MSTRAVYTFKDEYDTFHVYKHHDGYPTGAAEWIASATTKAWKLPRYEASDFAAAFIAANKEGGGDVRMCDGPDTHGDLSFTYEITCTGNGELFVEARPCRWDHERKATVPSTRIYTGPLSAFAAWAEEDEKANA